MFVCICKGISDRRIAEEVRRGHVSLKQIREACGAASDCGACVQQIRSLLAQHAPGGARHPQREGS